MGEVKYNFDLIEPLVPKDIELYPFLEIVRSRVRDINKVRQPDAKDFKSVGEEVGEYFLQPKSSDKKPQFLDELNADIALKMKREYGIDYDEEIANARRAMLHSVESLNIADDAKRIIRGRLDNINFNTREGRITTELNPDNNQITVNMSPALHWAVASQTAKAFRQSMNSGLLKSIIWASTGHELGHIIGGSIKNGKTLRERSATLEFGVNLMDDFPIQYKLTGDDDPDKEWLGTMAEERFASFFARDLLIGSGLSRDALLDENRVQMANVYGTGLHPFDLGFVLSSGIQHLNTKQNENNTAECSYGRRVLSNIIGDMIVMNTNVAEVFPFSQPTVEQILNNAWNVKQEIQVQ